MVNLLVAEVQMWHSGYASDRITSGDQKVAGLIPVRSITIVPLRHITKLDVPPKGIFLYVHGTILRQHHKKVVEISPVKSQ